MANGYAVGSDTWKKQREDEIQRQLHPVRYNELVGAIEVHRVGTQLRADYWYSEKERVIAGSKQKTPIRWCGKLLEKHYGQTKMSSHEIFSDFRAALIAAISGSGRLKRRWVDLEAFDRCGPHVDWRGVLELGG